MHIITSVVVVDVDVFWIVIFPMWYLNMGLKDKDPEMGSVWPLTFFCFFL